MNLKIANNLSLPVDTVTQSLAILARKRAGKSYLARGFAERLLSAKQQVVIMDPKGDWWGIRSSADGKSPGFPVVVLGGEHGDLPLEKTAAETIARLVVEERVSVLIDLSSLRKSEVAFFLGGDVKGRQDGFLEIIYRLKAQEKYRTPVMLIADEADAIAPQKPYPGEERMLGAMNDIVRRGGQRGIGSMLVTQRSAVVNKDVLTQTQVLIAMRTIAPQDMDAMMEWVKLHGTLEQAKTLKESLPSLPTGDAWVLSPGWPDDEGIYKRIHGLPITTFDSGATPKAGEKRIPPKTVADVDMQALKRRMAETIERAKADDPKELRRKIAELERAAKAPAAAAKSQPADPDALKKEFDRGVLSAKRAMAKEISRYQTAYEKILSRYTGAFNAARERLDTMTADLAGMEKPTIKALDTLVPEVCGDVRGSSAHKRDKRGSSVTVKERPILFRGEMVRAILGGNKTQTRRLCKPQPHPEFLKRGVVQIVPQWPQQDGVRWFMEDGMSQLIPCPHGKPGDRLWVRESLKRPDGDPWLYAADSQPVMVAKEDETAMLVWAHHKQRDTAPSIHMPRWACRLVLEISDVRVERLQDISEEDARAEGVDFMPSAPAATSHRTSFSGLWKKIHGAESWDANPWLWVISFKPTGPTEAA